MVSILFPWAARYRFWTKNVDQGLASNDRGIADQNREIARSTVDQLQSHLRGLAESKRNVDLQIEAEKTRLRIALEKAALVDKAIDRSRALADRGFISKVQFDSLMASRLDLSDSEVQSRQRVLALTKEQRGILDEVVSTRSSINVEIHKASLSSLQANQARFDVTKSEYSLDSPINGTVLDIRAVNGQSTPAGTPLAVIGTISPLGLEVYVPARDVSRVRVGQRATAVLADDEGRDPHRIIGRVMGLAGTSADSQALQNPELESKTSYFRAVIAISPSPGSPNGLTIPLKVGSSAYVNIQVGAESFLHWAFFR